MMAAPPRIGFSRLTAATAMRPRGLPTAVSRWGPTRTSLLAFAEQVLIAAMKGNKNDGHPWPWWRICPRHLAPASDGHIPAIPRPFWASPLGERRLVWKHSPSHSWR